MHFAASIEFSRRDGLRAYVAECTCRWATCAHATLRAAVAELDQHIAERAKATTRVCTTRAYTHRGAA